MNIRVKNENTLGDWGIDAELFPDAFIRVEKYPDLEIHPEDIARLRIMLTNISIMCCNFFKGSWKNSHKGDKILSENLKLINSALNCYNRGCFDINSFYKSFGNFTCATTNVKGITSVEQTLCAEVFTHTYKMIISMCDKIDGKSIRRNFKRMVEHTRTAIMLNPSIILHNGHVLFPQSNTPKMHPFNAEVWFKNWLNQQLIEFGKDFAPACNCTRVIQIA